MWRDAISNLAESYNILDNDTAHKAIVQLYNAQGIKPRSYTLKDTDAWCAAFITVLGLQLGILSTVLPECSVPLMVELYKRAGRWEEHDDYLPSKGDLLIYDWDDSGQGDNEGDPDHVGIVTARLGTSLIVVEGNRNGGVGLRTVSVNASYIRGYCLPDYDAIGRGSVPAWAQDEFQQAIDAGITDGSRPLAPCTRYEAAIMAWRASHE